MAVEKRILLARPHPFIVKEMRPFLEELGYVPVPVNSMEQLAQELAHPAHGAIISTAISSTVNADAASVFRMIRERSVRLPVVFAGMADLETVKVVAERAVKALVASPMFAGPQAYRAGVDRTSSFLVLRKDDLVAGTSHDAVLRALRSHFG